MKTLCTSHAASLRCSKCLKMFLNKENKLDFSGFERSQWILRDLVNDRIVSELYKHARTTFQHEALLKAHGVKYSVLLQLPYFDVIRCYVVDAMHKLLLGYCKECYTHMV